MKRERRELELTRINPWFFWETCVECRKEFRREKGWRVFGGPFYGGQGTFRYLCSTCAPTEEKAIEIFTKKPTLPTNPPRVPPKPRQRS